MRIIILLFLSLLTLSLSARAAEYSDRISDTAKINRQEVVARHNVVVNAFDSLASLTVGNGKFAYTVDFTGLQSFPSMYENGIPLGTQSEWGWHSFPNTRDYTFEESLKRFDYYDRQVPFAVQWNEAGRNKDAASYFRQNPHRLHLGVVGMDFFHKDGTPVKAREIESIHQVLNPWNGEIRSSFKIDGIPVEVITYCHQELDMISARIVSPLLEKGLICVKLQFPYPNGEHSDSGCDWNSPDKHESNLTIGKNTTTIQRKTDTSHYQVKLAWKGNASLLESQKHFFYLKPVKGQKEFSFSCLFSPENTISELPAFEQTSQNSKVKWEEFWMSGAAVDFSGSTNPQAVELERRVVLSQYLTKVQCTGNYPPQETGLTYNSWFGKFHLEMHWWHGVHFALWNREYLLERSLVWYPSILSKAEENAKRQGFAGVRWPKMTDPWVTIVLQVLDLF